MEETSPGEDDEWLEVVRGEPRTSTHSRGAVEGNTSSGESDEEKELSINEYDKKRVKQPLRENTKIQMNTRILSTELTCPICLDLLTNTMTTKECLHRFCADCITTALLRGNKECPTCRKKLVSKRSLRPDPNFDDLIRKIWPDRHRYDAMLLVADQDPGDSSLFAREVESADSAAKSCRDDQPSCSTAVSPKATTPPEVTESLEGFAAEEDSENGIFCDRRSPTWMRCGAICEEELNKEEKAQLLRFQKLADVIRKREEALGRSPVGTHSEKSLHGSSPLSIDLTSNDHSQSSRTGHLSPKMEVDGESSEGSSDDDQTSSDEGELPSTDGDSNESREDTRKDKVDDLPRIVKVERESDHKNGEEEDSARKKEDTDKKTFNNGISNGSREKSTSHHSTEDMEIGRERDLNGEDLSEEDIEEMHMLDNCILINPHLPTTPEFQHGSRMNSNPRKRSHKLSRRSNMGGEGSSQQGVPSSQDVDMESVTVLRDGLIGCAASTIKKQGATSVKEEGTIVPDKEPMFSPYPKTLEPFPEINAAIMYSTQNHSVNDSQPTAAEVNEEDDEDYEWEDEDCLDVYDIDEMLIQMCTNTQTQKTEEPSEPMEISVKEELLDEDCLPENIDRSKRERILANLKMLSAHYVNLCQESEKDLKELEGLKLGSLQHLQEIVNEEVETFEKVKQSQWYTSAERGDEVVYYESCELPTWKTKTRDGLTCEGLKAVANETISMKQLIYELSESSTSTTCSSSYLQSSPASSPLSVSSVDDQQQQPATPANEETKEDAGAEALPASTSSASVPLPVTPTKTNSHDFVYTEPQQHPSRPSTSHNVRPPYGAPQTTERLQQWLADAPANPLTPDDDRLERKFQNDEESGENEDAPPENYELEAELRPSASLLTRNVPREVCQTRFLRSHHTTSMEHLAEFLYQRWLEEVHSRVGQHEIAPDVPRPDHFYVFNSQERYCKCILLHESLVIAQAVTSKDSHVVLYFDTERAKISATEQSLLSKIVPIPDLDSAGNLSTGHVQQP